MYKCSNDKYVNTKKNIYTKTYVKIYVYIFPQLRGVTTSTTGRQYILTACAHLQFKGLLSEHYCHK